MDYEAVDILRKDSQENIDLAYDYLKSRRAYGDAKRSLLISLANAYKDGSIDRKLSFEKQMLEISSRSTESLAHYEAMLKEEEHYKGLEKVLDAVANHISLNQSIMKYTSQQGG